MKSSLQITQKYFDLSNQADLDAIDKLLHPEATYSSDNTGLHYGKDNIMLMMRGFFAKHIKLQWRIHSIEQLDKHISELHFQCDAIKTDGDSYQFSGVERLVVSAGMIRHIEVRV